MDFNGILVIFKKDMLIKLFYVVFLKHANIGHYIDLKKKLTPSNTHAFVTALTI